MYRLVDGVEQRVTGDTTDTDCVNPAGLLAVESSVACLPGSRLGQITKGGSEFKFVCRRKQHREGAEDPVAESRFDDFGVIGHNPATGATCFWDDNDGALAGTFDGEHIPDFDLTSGAPQLVEAYTSAFYDASMAACTACHDNDPFIYTSYLKSVTWRSTTEIRRGPYWLVGPDGMRDATGVRHLTAPAAEACTQCHRLAENATCERFALDSMGIKPSDRPFSTALVGMDGANFPSGFWMPDGQLPPTYTDWSAMFGVARATIQRCCENPDDAGCTWAEIPTEL